MGDKLFVLAPFQPAYFALDGDELASRNAQALEILGCCTACPRHCRVNRFAGERGYCCTGRYARVCSAHPHFGEEDCLRGTHGSGTIFINRCNLRCAFCQNADISQEDAGAMMPPALLAEVMLELQHLGCHNINFVSPGHVVPQIIEAIIEAIPQGLRVPVVYNSNGYDSVETLRLLDGLVDIYMPDFKFWEPETAAWLCDARDYPEHARKALEEMHRQVGVLRMGPDGIARRGVLVRHLVMPGQTDQSEAIFHWLAKTLSPDTYVNIMGQYHPAHRVEAEPAFHPIRRRPTREEMKQAYAAARNAGLWRFDHALFE